MSNEPQRGGPPKRGRYNSPRRGGGRPSYNQSHEWADQGYQGGYQPQYESARGRRGYNKGPWQQRGSGYAPARGRPRYGRGAAVRWADSDVRRGREQQYNEPYGDTEFHRRDYNAEVPRHDNVETNANPSGEAVGIPPTPGYYNKKGVGFVPQLGQGNVPQGLGGTSSGAPPGANTQNMEGQGSSGPLGGSAGRVENRPRGGAKGNQVNQVPRMAQLSAEDEGYVEQARNVLGRGRGPERANQGKGGPANDRGRTPSRGRNRSKSRSRSNSARRSSSSQPRSLESAGVDRFPAILTASTTLGQAATAREAAKRTMLGKLYNVKSLDIMPRESKTVLERVVLKSTRASSAARAMHMPTGPDCTPQSVVLHVAAQLVQYETAMSPDNTPPKNIKARALVLAQHLVDMGVVDFRGSESQPPSEMRVVQEMAEVQQKEVLRYRTHAYHELVKAIHRLKTRLPSDVTLLTNNMMTVTGVNRAHALAILAASIHGRPDWLNLDLKAYGDTGVLLEGNTDHVTLNMLSQNMTPKTGITDLPTAGTENRHFYVSPQDLHYVYSVDPQTPDDNKQPVLLFRLLEESVGAWARDTHPTTIEVWKRHGKPQVFVEIRTTRPFQTTTTVAGVATGPLYCVTEAEAATIECRVWQAHTRRQALRVSGPMNLLELVMSVKASMRHDYPHYVTLTDSKRNEEGVMNYTYVERCTPTAEALLLLGHMYRFGAISAAITDGKPTKKFYNATIGKGREMWRGCDKYRWRCALGGIQDMPPVLIRGTRGPIAEKVITHKMRPICPRMQEELADVGQLSVTSDDVNDLEKFALSQAENARSYGYHQPKREYKVDNYGPSIKYVAHVKKVGVKMAYKIQPFKRYSYTKQLAPSFAVGVVTVIGNSFYKDATIVGVVYSDSVPTIAGNEYDINKLTLWIMRGDMLPATYRPASYVAMQLSDDQQMDIKKLKLKTIPGFNVKAVDRSAALPHELAPIWMPRWLPEFGTCSVTIVRCDLLLAHYGITVVHPSMEAAWTISNRLAARRHVNMWTPHVFKNFVNDRCAILNWMAVLLEMLFEVHVNNRRTSPLDHFCLSGGRMLEGFLPGLNLANKRTFTLMELWKMLALGPTVRAYVQPVALKSLAIKIGDYIGLDQRNKQPVMCADRRQFFGIVANWAPNMNMMTTQSPLPPAHTVMFERFSINREAYTEEVDVKYCRMFYGVDTTTGIKPWLAPEAIADVAPLYNGTQYTLADMEARAGNSTLLVEAISRHRNLIGGGPCVTLGELVVMQVWANFLFGKPIIPGVSAQCNALTPQEEWTLFSLALHMSIPAPARLFSADFANEFGHILSWSIGTELADIKEPLMPVNPVQHYMAIFDDVPMIALHVNNVNTVFGNDQLGVQWMHKQYGSRGFTLYYVPYSAFVGDPGMRTPHVTKSKWSHTVRSLIDTQGTLTEFYNPPDVKPTYEENGVVYFPGFLVGGLYKLPHSYQGVPVLGSPMDERGGWAGHSLEEVNGNKFYIPVAQGQRQQALLEARSYDYAANRIENQAAIAEKRPPKRVEMNAEIPAVLPGSVPPVTQPPKEQRVKPQRTKKNAEAKPNDQPDIPTYSPQTQAMLLQIDPNKVQFSSDSEPEEDAKDFSETEKQGAAMLAAFRKITPTTPHTEYLHLEGLKYMGDVTFEPDHHSIGDMQDEVLRFSGSEENFAFLTVWVANLTDAEEAMINGLTDTKGYYPRKPTTYMKYMVSMAAVAKDFQKMMSEYEIVTDMIQNNFFGGGDELDH